MVTLAIIAALFLIAAGTFVTIHYGPLFGGFCLGGMNAIGEGVRLLFEALTSLAE